VELRSVGVAVNVQDSVRVHSYQDGRPYRGVDVVAEVASSDLLSVFAAYIVQQRSLVEVSELDQVWNALYRQKPFRL
jgi:hypothetical protein